ncbi:hypothetical protein BZM27_06320 [Paraburkholderia steynii]|uniref:Uncharacterized protein n=1 Tax=Paraburkholderia steynii TaxID=1245441 RepID=A0A4R0XNZ0_9BURK|nr:hypothetical protein BZM27_06320 [Paraburkholderia steynii]
MLANAEANVERCSSEAKRTLLRELADTPDQRYFAALTEATMRNDAQWWGYTFETALGSQSREGFRACWIATELDWLFGAMMRVVSRKTDASMSQMMKEGRWVNLHCAVAANLNTVTGPTMMSRAKRTMSGPM